ncbi:MAG: hypothetical protein QQM50_02150 [Dehalococcoides mccartyi]|jgi:hypothetical protein|uniref:hypothetical protein n=1 Tax=Dehalococcoides TaxID=61434 RepID=UPI000CDEE3B7|nr:hypothetical protein [Dehalococcoides mccartyi]MDP4279337.1 hypothetical protein [Dehalococcoides mccartyi]POZ59903.1 hypothetical protein C1O63_0018 [Dehalococcoides mccartyi]
MDKKLTMEELDILEKSFGSVIYNDKKYIIAEKPQPKYMPYVSSAPYHIVFKAKVCDTEGNEYVAHLIPNVSYTTYQNPISQTPPLTGVICES